MKFHNFFVTLCLVYTIGFGLLLHDHSTPKANYPLHNHISSQSRFVLPKTLTTTYNPTYTSLSGEHEPNDIHCPIPMKNRVFNYTGIQCVWSSIEMLGRWAEEPKLMNPPITSRSDCKSYSSPSLAAVRLNQLNVEFKQSFHNKEGGLSLIRTAMSEGRGCLFGVPGHAMVLVYFDEDNNIAKWVDNSDRTLKVQTMTVDSFMRVWSDSYWVLVIYADNDIIPRKMGHVRNPLYTIPIRDQNNPQGDYPQDYIPTPR
jgi:hypothetical protein